MLYAIAMGILGSVHVMISMLNRYSAFSWLSWKERKHMIKVLHKGAKNIFNPNDRIIRELTLENFIPLTKTESQSR